MTIPEPYYQDEHVTLYCGDNVAVMSEMKSDSIDLTVTSPPYGSLRAYGGHSWDFEGVAQQLWRVTKPGGVVVWVVADETVNGSESGESFRQALRFMEIGFRLHDTMIWEKLDPKPGDGKCRCHDCFEYMFVFSRGKPTATNIPRDVPCLTAGQIDKTNYDRRRNESGKPTTRKDWIRPEFGFRKNIWKTRVSSDHRNSESYKHPAAFPEALARDHILSWSNEGDTVLDCFAGSCTTLKMARKNGRHSIGIEVNLDYCEIGRKRLRQQVLAF